jgi:phosphoglycolate phosphatase
MESAARWALVFDLDGTLVDSLADICGNVNLVRRAMSLKPLDNEVIAPHIGQGVEFLVAGAFPEVPSARHGEVVEAFRRQYLATPHCGGTLYPGVAETLAAFRALPTLRLAVATNKYSPVAEQTLADYLPDVRFDAVFGPDRVARKKPSGQHLLQTLEAIAVPPERALYVGDTWVDREAARNAGIRFLAAGYGFGAIERGDDPYLERFVELLEHLPPGFPRPALR